MLTAMNKVMVLGNLTRDPDVRKVPSGMLVGSFGLAINERFTTRKGEDRDEVCFVEIEVWGKQADACGKYLSKGAQAFVEGGLRYNQWEDRQTGQKRSRLSVRAERVQFLGACPRENEDAEHSVA